MNDVVVGIDRSATAQRAAQAAAALANASGANLHLVMCVEKKRSVDLAVGGDHFHSDWLSDAEQFLDSLVWKVRPESISRSVDRGDPATMLCEEAKRLDARTIVVGNHRAQGLGRVLGSVAADVIRRAPCDVLVAQTSAED
jgi:nucleotide-binding universal stress UspA family protein